MKHRLYKDALGFTLVELSIVLVIIGLVIGGIVVGQTLIRSSELKSIASDVENIVAATNTFKLKYNCVAGDCTTATSFLNPAATCPISFGATPAACNGNGDGRVGGFINTQRDEMFQFWYQLGETQIYPGKFTGANCTGNARCASPGSNVPKTKFNPLIGYTVVYWGGYSASNGWTFGWSPQPAFRDHVIMIGINSSTVETSSAAFTSESAKSLDTKFDDGTPGRGLYATGVGCSTTSSPNTGQYNLSLSGISCALFFNYKL